MTIVVNLFGGPGTGKSTLASQIFTELKWKGVSVELVTEFAKDLVWEDRANALADQLYILGKQHHRIHRLMDKVDVIITDSPLLLSLIYGEDKMPLSFGPLVYDVFNYYDNMNYFLKRFKEYDPKGRYQNEDEAKELDEKIRGVLEGHGIRFEEIYSKKSGGQAIVHQILERLD